MILVDSFKLFSSEFLDGSLLLSMDVILVGGSGIKGEVPVHLVGRGILGCFNGGFGKIYDVYGLRASGIHLFDGEKP